MLRFAHLSTDPLSFKVARLAKHFGGYKAADSDHQLENRVSTRIKIQNSLKHPDTLDELTFNPRNGLSWYCCGPTVYSHSHLGHARCYVTFDAIRNALTNWFKVPTNYWMNITDIDDKIIQTAKELGQDHREVSSKWETDFFQQMDLLNVQRPDKVLRVSQHIPEIIDYIDRIIKNSFAYPSEGNIYFDVTRFRAQGFDYCKLIPSAYQTQTSSDISTNSGLGKRNPADFALWKAAKPGEPSWHSPWGRGRPGWHIECSAMIQTCLKHKQKLDLHTGGADLRFPHHSNEIAQGEAHDCSHDWVRYFLHVAPLNISGLKMSKSLKNFITIEQALQEASGHDLRMAFLSHHYSRTMQYDAEGTIKEAKAKCKSILSALHRIDSRLGSLSAALDPPKHSAASAHYRFSQFQEAVDESLRNDLNFPSVIEELCQFSKLVEQQSHQVDATDDYLSQARQLILKVSDHVLGLELAEVSRKETNKNLNSAQLLREFIEYRSSVVQATKQKDTEALFRLSDRVRDEVLPALGVKVEDNPIVSQEQASLQTASKAVQPSAESQNRDSSKSIFESPRYSKFNIGCIGADGLPALDASGKKFPQKVMDRFKRDLAKHQEGK